MIWIIYQIIDREIFFVEMFSVNHKQEILVLLLLLRMNVRRKNHFE